MSSANPVYWKEINPKYFYLIELRSDLVVGHVRYWASMGIGRWSAMMQSMDETPSNSKDFSNKRDAIKWLEETAIESGYRFIDAKFLVMK